MEGGARAGARVGVERNECKDGMASRTTRTRWKRREMEGGARAGARAGVGVERNGCKDGMASRTTRTRWKRRGVGVRCAPPASSLPWPPLPASPAPPCCVSAFAIPVPWPTGLGETSNFLYYPTASASAPRTPASAVERLAPPVLPSSPAPAAPAPLLARCTADVDGVQHPRGNRSCVGSGPTSRSFAGSASGSSTSFPLLFCITTDDTDGVYRPHGNMACIGVLGPSVLQLTLPALSSHRCAVSIPPGPRLRCAANALGQCLCLRRAPVAAPPQHRHYVDAMPGLRLSGEMRTSGIMEGEDRARGRARRTGQHGEGRMCGDDG
ncbi:hypothetical protein B0H14DRAFT_1139826 [Mycena olivaceomarginata]|nr:hypothetical protein B0H14DRAFT_1139826 [Mycena olivaceomarginata]